MILYKQVLQTKSQYPELTLLEIISKIMEDHNYDHHDIAEMVKNDRTLYDLIKTECQEKNLLKEKNNNQDINENF